jgi:DNA-binding IclR family transcriptional regulator
LDWQRLSGYGGGVKAQETLMAEISLTGDQMLTVLERVASDGPLSAAEVATRCGINRTVAHRLLSTLAQRAYVRRGEDGYALGPAARRLARNTMLDLAEIARPAMLKLSQKTGETVLLHGLDNFEAIVLDQTPGTQHLVRVEHRPGSRHALNLGASGWSLLACQNERFISRFLKRVDDPDAVARRIAQTREAGYSISHDELQMGVHGLATGLVGNNGACTASLGILVPGQRSDLLPSFHDDLMATAAEISRQID